MVAEWDAINWRRQLPSYLDDYLRETDLIVLVANTEYNDGVNPDKLKSIGFVNVPAWEVQSPVYSLWRKSTQAVPAEVASSMSVNNLGVELMGKAKYTEAEGRFNEALRLDPRNVLAQTNLGILHGAQGHNPLRWPLSHWPSRSPQLT